jgi:hypothetical protein
MNQNDIRNMADHVAQAVHRASIGDDPELWSDLTDEEQDDFRLIALAAMAAHDAWLTVAGYAIVQIPKKKAVATPRRALLGPDGKPLQ